MLYLPWKMIFYLGTGLVALVVVSLLTAPEPEASRRSFYDRLETPTLPAGEPETTVEPADPRDVAEAGQQSLLVNLLENGLDACRVDGKKPEHPMTLLRTAYGI